MRTSLKLLVTTLTMALAMTMAQGPRAGVGSGNGQGNGQGNGNGNGNGQGQQSGRALLDRTQLQEISGECEAVNMSAGTRYPSIVVAGQTIRLGPAWFLLENDFEIAVEDFLYVLVAPPANPDDPYVYAVSIRNATTQKEIQLRAERATAWASRVRGRGGNAEPSGECQQTGGCGLINPGEVTGAVIEVTMGFGLQQPNVVIAGPEPGQTMTIKLGPFRILDELGLVIEEGDTVTVEYGVSACTEDTVATAIIAGGVSYKLRNEDGSPAW